MGVPAGGAAAFQPNTVEKGKACSAGKCQFPWDPRALAGPRCTHPRCVSCDMLFDPYWSEKPTDNAVDMLRGAC